MTSVILTSSSSSSLSSNRQESIKYILLVDHDMTKETEKKMFEIDMTLLKKQSIAIHIFDYLSDSNRSIVELMENCEMLILNIADDKTKKYYNGYGERVKIGGEFLVVIYQYKARKHICDEKKKELRDTYFVDYIIKYIPTEQYKTKTEFLSNLCNDHMPKQKKSICEQVSDVINIFTKN